MKAAITCQLETCRAKREQGLIALHRIDQQRQGVAEAISHLDGAIAAYEDLLALPDPIAPDVYQQTGCEDAGDVAQA